MKKKIVYIAHPIGGDVENNIEKVKIIYRKLSIDNQVIPFAPYLTTLLALDDSNEKERLIGFSHNESLFKAGFIDEVWLFGGWVSNGMSIEIAWAVGLGIPVITMW